MNPDGYIKAGTQMAAVWVIASDKTWKDFVKVRDEKGQEYTIPKCMIRKRK